MNSRTDIQNELLIISETVAELPFCNVYAAPADEYFQMLSAEILLKINNIGESESSVPNGYFEGLSNEVLEKIKLMEEQKEELPEILKSIRHINVYKVPDNYFSALPTSVTTQMVSNVKVVGIERRLSVLKFAAAAAVVVFLGFGIYKLSRHTIVSDQGSLSALLKAANNINNNNSFDSEMSNLPDEEITNYLTEKGEDINTALVASLSDEQSLPEADEYLLDDNKLDNYLNENNIIKLTSNQSN